MRRRGSKKNQICTGMRVPYIVRVSLPSPSSYDTSANAPSNNIYEEGYLSALFISRQCQNAEDAKLVFLQS